MRINGGEGLRTRIRNVPSASRWVKLVIDRVGYGTYHILFCAVMIALIDPLHHSLSFGTLEPHLSRPTRMHNGCMNTLRPKKGK